MTSADQVQQKVQRGIAALRSGDGAAAVEIFEDLVADDTLERKPWLLLAQAHRAAGNMEGEADALDKALADDPRQLTALVMKAQNREQVGDDRAAISFYQTALNQASVAGKIPNELHALLQHGQRFAQQAQERFTRHLLDALESSDAAKDSAQVAQAIDLLVGRKDLFLQQPSMFYFPGLPQKQFYDPADFSWVQTFVERTDDLIAELQAVLADVDGFAPYVASQTERPSPNNPLRDDPSWGAWYLMQHGEPVDGHADRCPVTMDCLAGAPIPRIAGRSPMALYSRLTPGTHITPHNGMLNTRLICHIPLIVPGGCGLRVGNETREWSVGTPLIFDDSIEHEAWNRAEEDRVVLLFEFWRPELTQADREGVTHILAAIDDYGVGNANGVD